MPFLTASPFNLGSVPLQISPSGMTIGDLRVVDISENWNDRARLLAIRDAEDAKSTEVISITGARTTVSFAPAHDIPMNNVAALANLHKKILYRNISFKGSTMDSSDYGSLLALYTTAQIYWMNRQILIDKINNADIPFDTFTALITEYVNLTKPLMAMTTPLISGNVTFAQGASCSFTQAFEDHVNDFTLSVIQEVV